VTSDWIVAVGSTIVRAHQHAAGPPKGAPAGEPDDHALGRSRGGLTTETHLAALHIAAILIWSAR
jgi:hypothetical protein